MVFGGSRDEGSETTFGSTSLRPVAKQSSRWGMVQAVAGGVIWAKQAVCRNKEKCARKGAPGALEWVCEKRRSE